MGYIEDAGAFIAQNEGFLSIAKIDNDGVYRIGHGSSTITFNDSSYRNVRPNDTTTRENAKKDLTRRVPEFEQKVLEYIANYGVTREHWENLPDPAKVGLLDMAYNYGNLVKHSVREAIKTGDVDKIADAVLTSSINDNYGTKYYNGLRARRKREADLIRSQKKKIKGNKIIKLAIPFLLLGGLMYYFKEDLKKWVKF